MSLKRIREYTELGAGMEYSLDKAKRVVIKIGSALLVEQDSGALHQAWLTALAEDIAALHARGKQVVIVSSGSIALGSRSLNCPRRRMNLAQQQASAAVGQVALVHAYSQALAQHEIGCAQILLTLQDTESRPRYLNAKNTLEELLRLQIVPIINENDTVATNEIRYGDNDRLSARVAQMLAADCLVLLSDIDGLYTADPSVDADAQHLPEVRELSAAIKAMAGDVRSHYGSGGMHTKLAAAEIVMSSGCTMVVTNGTRLNPLQALQNGARATWFAPSSTPQKARKSWLAHHLKPAGQVMVDGGAVKALKQGRSLLAAGVTAVQGQFRQGELVDIVSQEGQTFARGLINYNAKEAALLAGHQSQAMADILGYIGSETVIHRDDLVLISS